MTIQELRKLEAAATPGPWADTTIGHRTQGQAAERARKAVMATRVPDDPKHKIKCTDLTFVDSGEAYVGMTGNGPKATNNAALIAATRNALPLLLDVVESAAAVLDEYGSTKGRISTPMEVLRLRLSALEADTPK